MFIRIKVREKIAAGQTLTVIYFPIDIKDLEAATLATYMDLGTSFAPIRADNFISLAGSQFPEIGPNTKISVSLVEEQDDDGCGDGTPPNNGKLVCCTVKNIGRSYNNKSLEPLSDPWKAFFNLDGQSLSAPDGTLFIKSNNKGNCVIKTVDDPMDGYLSYSILFAFEFNERNYHYVLDPVVHIRSGGTG